MADRNERHFLDFYTPARQRIGRFGGRRQLNTERQQKNRTELFSDGKENPTSERGDFRAAPATIAGEKAAGIGRQRRRIFTRSASKKKCVDSDHSSIIDTDQAETNDVNTSRAITSAADSALAFTPPSEVTSPTDSGSKLSRALFSANAKTTPMSHTIVKNNVSPDFYSPPGTSSLLKEYRSKQSLMSSSKNRISSFSSPITEGLRLRSPSLWKKGKWDKESKEDQRKKSDDSSLEIAIESSKPQKLEVTSTDVESTTHACDDSTIEISKSGTIEITPPSMKLSPTTPKTTPKRNIFWSPPGTSRLLRKYRQRTQQSDIDSSSFQSPPDMGHKNNYKSRTTPRGRRGLRLLDSGAKRCVNRGLSLKPRPAMAEATTPATSKARAKLSRTSSKVKDNRSLLSPLTAKRLNKDIQSYREAKTPRPLKQSIPLVDNADGFTSPEETTRIEVVEENHANFTPEDNEKGFKDNVDGRRFELASYSQPSSDSSVSQNAGGDTLDCTGNESVLDSMPFDEHEIPNPLVNLSTSQSAFESTMRMQIINNGVTAVVSSPEAITANPSDEDATEVEIITTTQQPKSTGLKSPLSPEAILLATDKDNETNSEVFRSTRSATRNRREEALHNATEFSTPISTSHTDSNMDSDETSGIFRRTRSATRARRKSLKKVEEINNAITAKKSTPNNEDDPNDDSNVFQGTRSATRARRQTSAKGASESVSNDNEEGVFRSTRSATRARRKSLMEAKKAVIDAEVAIVGSSPSNTTDNSLIADKTVEVDLNVVSSILDPTVLVQDENDTSSSKGSLQSIWDAMNCGIGESNKDSNSTSETEYNCNAHANIVSRVGDCVNPMAATLMNMWREEEKTDGNHQNQLKDLKEDVLKNGHELGQVTNTTIEDRGDGSLGGLQCATKPPPSKSFSSDLNLVYGLERVQNLTLSRPKALQATRTTSVDSSSIQSPAVTQAPKPLVSCSSF